MFISGEDDGDTYVTYPPKLEQAIATSSGGAQAHSRNKRVAGTATTLTTAG